MILIERSSRFLCITILHFSVVLLLFYSEPNQLHIITSSILKVSYYVYNFRLIHYLYIQEVTPLYPSLLLHILLKGAEFKLLLVELCEVHISSHGWSTFTRVGRKATMSHGVKLLYLDGGVAYSSWEQQHSNTRSTVDSWCSVKWANGSNRPL